MNVKKMDKFMKHCDRYFEQTDCMVLHPVIEGPCHVDVLLYKPTEKYPFWKLVTMGASDYKMPPLTRRGSFRKRLLFVGGCIIINGNERGENRA